MELFYEWALDLPMLWLFIEILMIYMSVIFAVYYIEKWTVKRPIHEQTVNIKEPSAEVPKCIFKPFFIVRRKIPSRKEHRKTTDEEPSFFYVAYA